jgi:hypothetical protein
LGTSITLFRLSSRPNKLRYDWAEAEKIFQLDGPMPRLFQEKMLGGIKIWRKARDVAIHKLGYTALRDILLADPTDISNYGEVSHKVFLVSRENLGGSSAESDGAVISIITPDVQKKLHKKLIQLQRAQLLDLYKLCSGATFTRRMAGVFYEAYCFQRLMNDGVNLELLKMIRRAGTADTAQKRKQDSDSASQPETPPKMVRLSGAAQKRKQDSDSTSQPETPRKAPEPRFYSSHQEIENEDLEKERERIMRQKETVTISRNDFKVKYYDKLGGKWYLRENTLYIPEASNERCLDAFFKHGNYLYILQFTIADTHQIKRGLVSLKTYGNCPPPNNWKFVFIIDGSQILKVPVPTGDFEYTIYSAIMRDESNLHK